MFRIKSLNFFIHVYFFVNLNVNICLNLFINVINFLGADFQLKYYNSFCNFYIINFIHVMHKLIPEWLLPGPL